MVENLLEILTKRRSQTFYTPIDVHSLTNQIGENIYLISIWNIAIQLGKYDFSCWSIVNNLKVSELFFDQISINSSDLILASDCWNWSAIENLRYLNSAVNKII